MTAPKQHCQAIRSNPGNLASPICHDLSAEMRISSSRAPPNFHVVPHLTREFPGSNSTNGVSYLFLVRYPRFFFVKGTLRPGLERSIKQFEDGLYRLGVRQRSPGNFS
jgi:hypothetical protein